jgi:hypothetical protein
MIYLRLIQKQEQTEHEISRWKEIMIRAEINEM